MCFKINFFKKTFLLIFTFGFAFQQILCAVPSLHLNDVLAPTSEFPTPPAPPPQIISPQKADPYEINHKLSTFSIDLLFSIAIRKGAFKNASEEERAKILKALKETSLLTHSRSEQVFLYNDVVDVVSYLEWYSKDKSVPYRLIRSNMISKILIHESIEKALRSRVDFDVLDKLLLHLFWDRIDDLSEFLQDQYGYSINANPEGKENRKIAFYHLLSDIADDYDEDGQMRKEITFPVPDPLRAYAFEIFHWFKTLGGVDAIADLIRNPKPPQQNFVKNVDSKLGILFESARNYMNKQEEDILGVSGSVFKYPSMQKQDAIEQLLTDFKNNSQKDSSNQLSTEENREQILEKLRDASGLTKEELLNLLKYFSIHLKDTTISEEQWSGFKSAFLSHVNPLVKPKRVAMIGTELLTPKAKEFILKESKKSGLEPAMFACGKKNGNEKNGNEMYELSFFGGQAVVTKDSGIELETMMKNVDFKLLGIEALVIGADAFEKIEEDVLLSLRKKGIEIFLIGSLSHEIPTAYGPRIEAQKQREDKNLALFCQVPNTSKTAAHVGASVIARLLKELVVDGKPGKVLCAGIDTFTPDDDPEADLPGIVGKGGSQTLRDALKSELQKDIPTFNSVFYKTKGKETSITLTFYVDRPLSKEKILQAFEVEALRNIIFSSTSVETQQTSNGTLISLTVVFDDEQTHAESVIRFIAGKPTKSKILQKTEPVEISLISFANEKDSETTKKLGRNLPPLREEFKQELKMWNIKKSLKKELEKIEINSPEENNFFSNQDNLNQLYQLIGKISDPDVEIQILRTDSKVVGVVVAKKVLQNYHLHACSLLSSNTPEETSITQEPYYKALREIAFNFKEKDGIKKVTVLDTYKPEKNLRVVFKVSGESSIELSRWEKYSDKPLEQPTVLCHPNLEKLQPLKKDHFAVVVNGGTQIGALAIQITTPSKVWFMGVSGSNAEEFAELVKKGSTVKGKFPVTVETKQDCVVINGKQFACFTVKEEDQILLSDLPWLPFLFAGIPITVIEGNKPDETKNTQLLKAGARAVLQPSSIVESRAVVLGGGLHKEKYTYLNKILALASLHERIVAHLAHVFQMAVDDHEGIPLTDERILNLADTFQKRGTLPSLGRSGKQSDDSFRGQTFLLPGHIIQDNLQNAANAMKNYIEGKLGKEQKNVLGLFSDILALIDNQRVQIKRVTHEDGAKESILKIDNWSQDELEYVRAMINLLNDLRPQESVLPNEIEKTFYSDRMTIDQLIEEKGADWFKGKKIFMRVDFNVVKPVEGKATIVDDFRIQAVVPDIKKLQELGTKVILASHNGRFNDIAKEAKDLTGKYDVKTAHETARKYYSLELVAKKLKDLVGADISFKEFSNEMDLQEKINSMENGEVCLLENLRFHEGEEKKDPAFVEMLYNGIRPNVYVMSAFGTAHRGDNNASINPLIKEIRIKSKEVVPVVLGKLVGKELTIIKDFLNPPSEDSGEAIAILGGAKDKVEIMESLITKKLIKKLVILGLLASPFLVLQGHEIGNAFLKTDSKTLREKFTAALKILTLAKEHDVEIILPVDVKGMNKSVQTSTILTEDEINNEIKTVNIGEIKPGFFPCDIGPKTIELIGKLLKDPRYTRLLVNGTAGIREVTPFNEGTDNLLKIALQNKKKMVVLGGDGGAAVNDLFTKMATAEIFKNWNYDLETPETKALVNEKKADMIKELNVIISTGGGAALKLIDKGRLSGLKEIDYVTKFKERALQEKFFVGALWRNPDGIDIPEKALEWITEIAKVSEEKYRETTESVIFPQHSVVESSLQIISDQGWNSIKVGIQDITLEENPSSDLFTAEKAKALGVDYLVLGYTDRNKKRDDPDIINKKIKAALKNGLTPILYIGENKEDRVQGAAKVKEVIENQLKSAFAEITELDAPKIMLAYQPVWAIGTGEPASPQIIDEIIGIILDSLNNIDESIASKIVLLYGGSVKESNTFGIVSRPGVNGCIVGSASEKKEAFLNILGQIFVYTQRIQGFLEKMKNQQPQIATVQLTGKAA